MVDSICNELILKKSRLPQEIKSIYFGGGTPSILPEMAFRKIFETLYSTFQVSKDAEITIEANPDDLNIAQLRVFKQLPVNRFSIGVQSFYDEDLKWMNRAHSAMEAESSIKRAQDVGFENLTIDLIYGYPLLSDEKWANNLEMAIQLETPHVSAYAMTVEPKTALAHAIQHGKQPKIDEAQSAKQFTRMVSMLKSAQFEQYEISNFAKNKQYAVHNTNYWKGIPFIGIGPSAHGFDGQYRYFNIANNQSYLHQLQKNELAEASEKLSQEDQFNEYVMTSLRTMWGLDLSYIKNKFGDNPLNLVEEEIQRNLKKGNLIYTSSHLILTEQGKLYADRIASDLFLMGGDLEKQ